MRASGAQYRSEVDAYVRLMPVAIAIRVKLRARSLALRGNAQDVLDRLRRGRGGRCCWRSALTRLCPELSDQGIASDRVHHCSIPAVIRKKGGPEPVSSVSTVHGLCRHLFSRLRRRNNRIPRRGCWRESTRLLLCHRRHRRNLVVLVARPRRGIIASAGGVNRNERHQAIEPAFEVAKTTLPETVNLCFPYQGRPESRPIGQLLPLRCNAEIPRAAFPAELIQAVR